MLMGQGGAGAWFATDAAKTLPVEFIVGNIEGFDVIPDLSRIPIGQRVEFDQTASAPREGMIALDLWEALTGIGVLIASLPRDPGVQSGQFAA